MNNYKIISDSSLDLTNETVKKLGIEVVPFSVSYDGVTYYKEMVDIYPDEFYAKLVADDTLFPKTSLPNINEYQEVFEKHLENGQDVLCFTVASSISGSYQSAVGAKNAIDFNKFPNRKVIVVNSTTCSITQGGLILESCQMKEDGFDIDKNLEICNEIMKYIKVYFTVDSLAHLQKGGRIGKAAAFTGNLLNIKPILRFAEEEVVPVGKIRGRKKALQEVAKMLNDDVTSLDKECKIFTCHTASGEDKGYLDRILIDEYNLEIEDEPNFAGIAVGAHHGPTSVGCGYLPTYKNFI